MWHRIRHRNGLRSQDEMLKNLTEELAVQNLEREKINVFRAIVLREDYVFNQEDEIAAPKGQTRCICLPFWVG